MVNESCCLNFAGNSDDLMYMMLTGHHPFCRKVQGLLITKEDFVKAFESIIQIREARSWNNVSSDSPQIFPKESGNYLWKLKKEEGEDDEYIVGYFNVGSKIVVALSFQRPFSITMFECWKKL
jgi:hypothetical protein